MLLDSKEKCQQVVDKKDAMTRWVLEHMKPGMEVRFSGMNINSWRVLEVRVTDQIDRESYVNPDYIEFTTEFPASTPEYFAAREEWDNNHPENNFSVVILRTTPVIFIVGESVDTTEKHVIEKNALFLYEVKVGEEWVKVKDLMIL